MGNRVKGEGGLETIGTLAQLLPSVLRSRVMCPDVVAGSIKRSWEVLFAISNLKALTRH